MDSSVLTLIVLGVSLIAAVTDLWKGKIYNWLTYPAVLAGIVLNGLLSGPQGLVSSLAGIAVAFVPLFVLFITGAMRGGDVKMMVAIGAIKGYPFIVNASFYIFLAAGCVALIHLLFRGELFQLFRSILLTPIKLLMPAMKLPPIQWPTGTISFGPPVFLGCLWMILLERAIHG